MKLTTDLLSRWLGALGSKAESGSQRIGTNDLVIPGTISPVIHVPGPLATSMAPAAATVVRDSACVRATAFVPQNTAAASNTFLTLGRGTWRLQGTLFCVASFADFTTSLGGIVQLVDPVSASAGHLANLPIHTTLSSIFFSYEVTLPVDGWIVQHVAGTTGAVQTLVTGVAFNATRLI